MIVTAGAVLGFGKGVFAMASGQMLACIGASLIGRTAASTAFGVGAIAKLDATKGGQLMRSVARATAEPGVTPLIPSSIYIVPSGKPGLTVATLQPPPAVLRVETAGDFRMFFYVCLCYGRALSSRGAWETIC